MDKMIFLNVGWMSEYSGLDKITGGGKAVAIQGYGHEMLNFKPFAGRMYGTAVTPGFGDINLERLGAAKGSSFVDGVLVVWVAKSRIVGWYRNARVFRRSQQPPKNSGRSYKSHSIGYRMTAVQSFCTILDPDARHFPVPRAREREHAMGRYIWYAEGASNRAFRKKVLRYVAAGGQVPVHGKGKKTKHGGGGHQSDLQKKTKVEQSAIDLTTGHFEKLNYVIETVEYDNVGWDLNAVHSQSGARLRLEVKGLSGEGVNVELTPNEYKMMKKHKQTYRICVGTNCLEQSHRRLAVFAFNDASSSWVDGIDRSLQITEVKSARLRLR
jgi:Domain of unknown function (DUF3883)